MWDRRPMWLWPLAFRSDKERVAPDFKMTNSWRAQLAILVRILTGLGRRPV